MILASDGYPVKYASGFPISIPEKLDAEVYIAGAKLSEGKLLSSGGRVLGVSCTGESLREAIDRAYAAAGQIHFENAYCRRDIGARALACKGEN